MSVTPRALWRALRPKQWTKNAVVLAALVFALGDPKQEHLTINSVWIALVAMLVFCAASSGIYVVNDICDLEKDRLHPTKRLRPLAAGQMSINAARVLSAFAITMALVGAWRINREFLLVIGGYLALQAAYTFALKRVALLDTFIISIGFVLRALAGAVAIRVTISPWLLGCTLLLSLFLALCKRRHELVVIADAGGETRDALRGYSERMLDTLIGVTSGGAAISYGMYTIWPDTVQKFGTRGLVFSIPFVVIGLARYLRLVYSHEKGGRPEQILLTDLPLLLIILLYGMTVGAVLIWGRGAAS